ncbi:MAG: hypothetical protein H6767_05855 [Candidatus Peribacteria bacterium]|nr:MAG: hypothetical protein H6767_05855 [Candidatus Peribacteria bacterium]
MKDPKAENADYSEATRFSNNVYLSFIVIEDCEDILYTFYAQQKVKNTLNSVMVWDNSEVVYYSTAIIHSYEVFYSRYIVDSSRIWFSSNLMGCRDCIFCNDLQNQQYYIKNIPYTKEEYKKKKQEILAKKSFFQGYYEQVNTEANNFASEGVQGNFCVYSENVTNGYFCYRVRNAHNAYFVGDKNGRNRILDTVCSDQSSP